MQQEIDAKQNQKQQRTSLGEKEKRCPSHSLDCNRIEHVFHRLKKETSQNKIYL